LPLLKFQPSYFTFYKQNYLTSHCIVLNDQIQLEISGT